jgi:hypothetical protein
MKDILSDESEIGPEGGSAVQVMIRYKVKRDQLERELDLLRGVYEELEARRPDGLRYASFQLEDEVSFVEFAETDGPGRFSQLDAFRAYRSELDERCEEPPVVAELDQVGSFGFGR